MQSDNGKLFVGGISWDTDEERLKEYFGSFGEVLEAVIMKDWNTGRARGFGFVVFADSSVAERVIKEKHNIDGRMVEAKRAVPRVDQNVLSRNSSASTLGSPGPSRTKKIFVGGLASTVTESDFKKYFEQFGTITDVVVMYDHNTQRPRGFGFITYESESAVDKVLTQTFHELNGKMVEVKRAVPKELSPGPSFSPFSGYNYSPSRINSLLNGYAQGFVPAAVGAYGLRMNDRFSPIPGDFSRLPPFGSGYGMGNLELAPNPSYGDRANYSNNLNYGRGVSAYYIGNANRFPSSVGYDGGHGGNSSFSLWGNAGLNDNTDNASSNAYRGAGVGSIGGSIERNSAVSWGYAGHAARGGGNNVGHNSLNVPYGADEGLHSGGHGRIGGSSVGRTSLYGGSNGSFDGPLTDLYGGEYGDATWQPSSSEHDGPGTYVYGLGIANSDGTVKKPDYVGGYTANGQSNRCKSFL